MPPWGETLHRRGEESSEGGCRTVGQVHVSPPHQKTADGDEGETEIGEKRSGAVGSVRCEGWAEMKGEEREDSEGTRDTVHYRGQWDIYIYTIKQEMRQPSTRI